MQKKNNTKKTAKNETWDLAAEQERCEQQADAVLYFLTLDECANASTPDFVTDAIVDAIAEAGVLVGFPTPTYAPEESEAQRRKMLAELFSQTQMLRLRDRNVQRAVLELLHNPETPGDLYEAVAGFLCERSNIGPNLFHTPEGVNALLKYVPEEELRGYMLAEREKANAVGGVDNGAN
jgi:hypothetical protein